MKPEEIKKHIESLISAVELLVPVYASLPGNKAAEGVCAICIIDEEGNINGKMFGTDRLKQREKYRAAWLKASQTWITGMKTFDYEQKVFNGDIDYKHYGIQPPDFIGWRGGQPVELNDGTRLSVGFSGFSQKDDLEIIGSAMQNLKI